ncbi:MAG: TVP38/TMEM64 family protein [Clostridia bacterium]|nr:TVP38/TMEM64 family protein [Clostridia bacterium]
MDRYSRNTAQSSPPKKPKKRTSFLTKSILTFVVLVVVEAFLFLVLQNIDLLYTRFDWVVSKLEYAQQFIVQYMSAANNIALTILILLFIYFVKAYVPLFPLSLVCMIGGIVFGKYWWVALIINLLGLSGMFYLRFNSGRVKGENYMQNLLRKNKYVRLALDVNGVSSYSLLALFRFFPCFPINFVSRLYGANKDCKFQWYMLVSVLAISPRVYVYTRIGREIFNPFSRNFVILLMIFVAFGGVGVFIANTVFYIKRKNDDTSATAALEEQQATQVLQENSAQEDAKKERYIPILPEDLEELDGMEYDDIQRLRNKFNGREL